MLALLLLACAAPAGAPASRTPAIDRGATAAPADSGATAAPATAIVMRSPTCSCCGGHEAYLRDAGMEVLTVMHDDMAAVKDDYAVPADMRSCHTTDVAGYFVEGHVPLAAIDRLLAERPDIDGIALPGMPAGAPGMGGQLAGPLVVWAISDGAVVGEFGSFGEG